MNHDLNALWHAEIIVNNENSYDNQTFLFSYNVNLHTEKFGKNI